MTEIPSPPSEMLYHYCSSDAFLSILKNRSIWLSSLSLANDTMEGRLLRHLFMEKANTGGIDAGVAAALEDRLELVESIFDGLAFCLSTNGDQLSQWRGYADEARGFAIGFSRHYLAALAQNDRTVRLKAVVYDPAAQRTVVDALYEKIITPEILEALKPVSYGSLLTGLKTSKDVEADVALRASRVLSLVGVLLTEATEDLYSMKGAAFSEEGEWRLVTLSTPAYDNVIYEIDFRCGSGKLIPYRSLELRKLDVEPVIEVVVGPRNPTPLPVIQSFMRRAGFEKVTLRQSFATYR
ncbi:MULTISPECIES: DUF2971 domain-containing protein [unclassified Luteibacter]|uniref:DUF2971 domain-containing protein n=1 Tax=Luteibacter sp. PvP019 TaxID=3156436 RepID=UPI0033972D76